MTAGNELLLTNSFDGGSGLEVDGAGNVTLQCQTSLSLDLVTPGTLSINGLTNTSQPYVLNYDGSSNVAYSSIPSGATGPTGATGPAGPAFTEAFNVSAQATVFGAAPVTYTFVNLSTSTEGTFNNSVGFNLTTGAWGVVATGNYYISMNINYRNTSASTITPDILDLQLYNSSTSTVDYDGQFAVIQSGDCCYSWSNIFRLTSGDTYNFRLLNSLSGTASMNAGIYSHISMQRLV
jgi:hypothetical protein